jgi:hypothetical protein
MLSDSRNIARMTDVEAIKAWLLRSGWVAQSVDAVMEELPRWVQYLRSKGVTQIPDSPLTGSAEANNWLSLLARQSSDVRDSAIEHELRNLTGIRPYKQ